MKTKMYWASVRNKETNQIEIIKRDDYSSKKDFAHDLRVNGYAVRFISTPDKFDEDCENYYWECEKRKNVRKCVSESKKRTETTTEMDDSGKDANNTDFQQQLYNAEYNKTFTVQGGIERFLKLAKEFVKNKSAEISLIVDTAAQVLHDKYGLDYGTIETLEIEAYNS